MTELDPQHCALKSVQTIVISKHSVMISLTLPLIAQDSDSSCVLVMGCDNRPALPVSAEVLGRIEAEAGKVTEASCVTSFVLCAVRLRGVFNNQQIVSACNIENRIHIRALPIQMHGHDCFGAWCDRGFYLCRIHGV